MLHVVAPARSSSRRGYVARKPAPVVFRRRTSAARHSSTKSISCRVNRATADQGDRGNPAGQAERVDDSRQALRVAHVGRERARRDPLCAGHILAVERRRAIRAIGADDQHRIESRESLLDQCAQFSDNDALTTLNRAPGPARTIAQAPSRSPAAARRTAWRDAGQPGVCDPHPLQARGSRRAWFGSGRPSRCGTRKLTSATITANHGAAGINQPSSVLPELTVNVRRHYEVTVREQSPRSLSAARFPFVSVVIYAAFSGTDPVFV